MRSAACFLSVVLLLATLQCEAQLSPTFYDKTCPTALTTIQTSIRLAVSNERRMAASLVRLHFHDCFVQGCDASVLLDDNVAQSERSADVNVNSLRGFEVIEAAKAQVESICPGVVSCADILAVAARDASTLVGGPTWQVKFGRKDSTTANLGQANTDLPRFIDNLDTLISKFAVKGFNAKEMVTLSGAHSIGQGRCVTFRDRIYSNATNIDASFARTRRLNCPQAALNGDNNLAPIDFTPNQFDNNYYTSLTQKKGLFSSDQVLFNGGSTDNIVLDYSKNPKTFLADFAAVMVKIGDMQALTGQNGIIRKICSAPK